MRKTPFGKVKKKLVPIFPHVDIGMVYVVSTGFPDPNIFPPEVQEGERNAGTVQYLLNVAAVKLGKELGISPVEAKKLFAPQGEKEEIAYDYTMYLEENELVRLFENLPQINQREDQIKKSVGLIMRHRVARTAVILDASHWSSGTLSIDAWFDFKVGDRVLINSTTYTIASVNLDQGIIKVDGNNNSNVKVGDSIVLLQSNGEVATGDEQWSDEDTLALRSILCKDGTTAFDAVYQFFLAEVSGNSRTLETNQPKQEESDPIDMGEYKNGSVNSSAVPQLIGVPSFGG